MRGAGSKVVRETASLLLSVDEAQDVSIAKYGKDFEGGKIGRASCRERV